MHDLDLTCHYLVFILLLLGVALLTYGLATGRPGIERLGLVAAVAGTTLGIAVVIGDFVFFGTGTDTGSMSEAFTSHAHLGKASVAFAVLALLLPTRRHRLPNGDVARIALLLLAVALALCASYVGLAAESEPVASTRGASWCPLKPVGARGPSCGGGTREAGSLWE